MRLRTLIALIAAALAIVTIIWGLSGFLLGFFYAIPVVLISTSAAKWSEPKGRVQLFLALWLTTRPLAFFVGFKWAGWIGGLVLLGVVMLLESVAIHAHRRASA